MGSATDKLARQALEQLPRPLLIAGGTGRVLNANRAARDALGPGETLSQLLGEPPGGWADELASLEIGRARTRRGVRARDPQGRCVAFDVTMCRMDPLPGPDAEGTVLILLQPSGGPPDMQQFIAKLAHELNSPLDGVLRFLGLAERTDGDPAEYLQRAREGLRRMAGIIRDLLEDAGRGRRNSAEATLHELLAEAIELMRARAGDLGVSIARDLDARVGLHVNGGLFQVFCNVIRNALDAMPDGGELHVCTRLSGDSCVIEFADTGCGLPAGEAERIFEPFYTTKPEGKGIGLGLAVSRELVARAGGSIEASPNTPAGTRVLIRLPAPGRDSGAGDTSPTRIGARSKS